MRTVVEASVQSWPISICLAVHHARLEHLGLHRGGREPAHQPELDLGAAIEAAHVGDEGVDQITKPTRSGRTAIEARQQVLVVRHRGTSPRRELTQGRRCSLDDRTISEHRRILCSLRAQV